VVSAGRRDELEDGADEVDEADEAECTKEELYAEECVSSKEKMKLNRKEWLICENPEVSLRSEQMDRPGDSARHKAQHACGQVTNTDPDDDSDDEDEDEEDFDEGGWYLAREREWDDEFLAATSSPSRGQMNSTERERVNQKSRAEKPSEVDDDSDEF
jgi:hypothetical protein